MASRRWTAADTRALRRLAAQGKTLCEIGEAMGRCSRHVNTRAVRSGVAVRRVCDKRRWSDDEIETVRINYPHFPAFLIAHVLDRGESQVSHLAARLGIGKAPDFYTQPNARLWNCVDHPNSIATRIKPGAVPANKGLRRPGYAPGRMAATQFKKGARPHTWKSVGSERINSEGYRDRKVSDTGYPPRDWQPVHRLVWIAHHGPVPRGRIVVFKPGCRRTCEAEITIDRVECITFEENMRRNTCHNRYPKEIVRAIQMRGALNRKINRLSKETAPQPNRRSKP